MLLDASGESCADRTQTVDVFQQIGIRRRVANREIGVPRPPLAASFL